MCRIATPATGSTTVGKRQPTIQGSGGGRSGSADYRQAPKQRVEGVVIAYPHRPGDVNARFHTSLIDLLAYDVLGGMMPDGTRSGGLGRIIGHGGHMPLSSGANIVTARNKLVRKFLDESKADFLCFLDDDMTFGPDTVDRLVDSTKWSAEEEKQHLEVAGEPSGNKVGDMVRPIMGGLCFALMKGEAQEIVPTVYGFSQGNRMIRYNGYAQNAIVQVAGTGAACLLVHRSVFETMRRATWSEENEKAFQAQSGGLPSGRPVGDVLFKPPWPWFQETITGSEWGDSISEDLTFCLRAAQCGFPVYVNTSIKTGHVKPVVIDEEAYFKALPPEEEDAPTYVVIPVKGQQQFTDAVLLQLMAQGGYDDVFVYDNAEMDEEQFGLRGSEADEHWPRHNIHIIPAKGLNIHEMWNLGIKEAISRNPRCNIAILNNDLELGEDFLKRLADGLRAHPQIAAVCPNYDGRVFPEKVQAVKGIAAGRMDGTGGLAGFAFMVRGEIFAAGCPLFDEGYHLWYGDNVFLDELDKADASYGIVRDCTVVHIGGGSNTSGDGKGKRLTPELAELVKEDEQRYQAWRAAQ